MKVGFSSADITPAIGMEQPGGFSKAYHQRIHDACCAKAMVLSADGVTVAFVGLDALSIKKSVVARARELIEARTGIPGGNVMVGASHTHSGGPVDGARPGDFNHAFDPEFCEHLARESAVAPDLGYLDHVATQIATAVITAHQRQEEALVSLGRGHEDTVAFNRRFWMDDGKQATHPGKGNPRIAGVAGPIDPEVGVLGAWRPDGSFIGCLVNYACHGTTGNPGASADWIHWMRQCVSGGMGGGEVVFLNGACGDVTQVDNLSPREGEFGEKWSRRVGQKIGAEGLKVLSEAEPQELTPLAVRREVLSIACRTVPEARFQAALDFWNSDAPEGWDKWWARGEILLHEKLKVEPAVACELQAIQVGPLVVLSNPAEYFCQFGLNIKQRSQFPYTWVVELANGCIGYVPTPEAMGPQGGGYEPRLAMSSRLVPEAGQMIEDACVELAAAMTPGAAPAVPLAPVQDAVWEAGSASTEDV